MQGIFSRWANYEKASADRLDSQIYMKKMLSLDYVDVDRQAVFDLYSQIKQNANWAGWGIHRTLSFFEDLVTAVVQILGGIGLSMSLFLLNVPQDSSLAFINHPLIAVGIVGFMLLISVVAPLCSNQIYRYWIAYAPESRLANRFFGFYATLSANRSLAPDVRMYEQEEKVC